MPQPSIQIFHTSNVSQMETPFLFPTSSISLSQEAMMYDPIHHHFFEEDATLFVTQHENLSSTWLNSDIQGLDDLLLSPSGQVAIVNKGIGIKEPVEGGNSNQMLTNKFYDKR